MASVGEGTVEMRVISTCIISTSIHCYFITNLKFCNHFSLCRVSASVTVSFPAVVVALQVYCPPWDVRKGVKFRVLLWATVELVISIPISLSLSILIPSGVTHCTVKSSVSEPPSSRVTVQMKENSFPAVRVPVGEIVTLGRGAVEWMEYVAYS